MDHAQVTIFHNGQEMKDLVPRFKAEIPVRDRYYRMRKIKEVFSGREACSWLIAQKYASDDSDAVDLGNKLIQIGVFRHVESKELMRPSPLAYYRFSHHEFQKLFERNSTKGDATEGIVNETDSPKNIQGPAKKRSNDSVGKNINSTTESNGLHETLRRSLKFPQGGTNRARPFGSNGSVKDLNVDEVSGGKKEVDGMDEEERSRSEVMAASRGSGRARDALLRAQVSESNSAKLQRRASGKQSGRLKPTAVNGVSRNSRHGSNDSGTPGKSGVLSPRNLLSSPANLRPHTQGLNSPTSSARTPSSRAFGTVSSAKQIPTADQFRDDPSTMLNRRGRVPRRARSSTNLMLVDDFETEIVKKDDEEDTAPWFSADADS
uniref:DEP domain-containing protein n=1 Tax=Timspurckia oligopyrenoides TaxID=708627 RepID=A0A7S0ZEP4_9RHOD|mmetsp:Transcript_2329/g.4080  ORF Transcript_2329/g.4080 Transcript_2329/m.4080 type:complete len:377 (+) Transcript_2329:53-1183(+)|eukprot:CAMPEP_0182441360 /NCGR_PEP_ID=MMETSP1172-20130603/285_1 /TAXON_ID=708627 /ORGANISM="Timspurckia oligopyrenoides, Strain CCMP3278" /LENGTH=376 /DNA_ID=CAMNT_0024635567 /DNA_START=40 /DNA_END=1170 /DNA_ORIENTATION=-